MGLLERIRSVLRANLNEALRRAEDPEQALDQLIRTMEADLAEARAGVAAAVRDERRLRDNYEYHRRQVDVMLDRATAAVKQGKDELAKEALRRRKRHQSQAEDLRVHWELERGALDELRSNLAGLQDKIEQARRKREALLARRRLARARRELQQQNGAANERALDRLEETIDDAEAEAEAYAELAVDDVTRQIERLHSDPRADEREIEAELQGIKQRLRKSK